MSETQNEPKITIIANEIVQASLKPMLEQAELLNVCCFEEHQKQSVILRFDKQETTTPMPVRIGALFDQINRLSKKEKKRSSALLDLGHGILNTDLGNFDPVVKKSEDKEILLTEKEVEILRYLFDNQERKISREELLEFVWGYAKTTETHTLETHIYRLRQKIEPDPANPTILKKDEDGYFLGL